MYAGFVSFAFISASCCKASFFVRKPLWEYVLLFPPDLYLTFTSYTVPAFPVSFPALFRLFFTVRDLMDFSEEVENISGF